MVCFTPRTLCQADTAQDVLFGAVTQEQRDAEIAARAGELGAAEKAVHEHVEDNQR
jgi:hypothetical protein